MMFDNPVLWESFDWRHELEKLKDPAYDDRITSLLKNNRSKTQTVGVKLGKEELKKFLTGGAAFVVDRVVVVGNWKNSYLPKGLSVLDVPGSGDPKERNNNERRNALRRAQAALMVTAYERLGEDATKKVVEELRNCPLAGKTLFDRTVLVVNRLGIDNEEDIDDFKDGVEAALDSNGVTIPASNIFYADKGIESVQKKACESLGKYLEDLQMEYQRLFLAIMEKLQNLLVTMATELNTSVSIGEQEIHAITSEVWRSVNALRANVREAIKSYSPRNKKLSVRAIIEAEIKSHKHHHLSALAFAVRGGRYLRKTNGQPPANGPSDVPAKLAQEVLRIKPVLPLPSYELLFQDYLESIDTVIQETFYNNTWRLFHPTVAGSATSVDYCNNVAESVCSTWKKIVMEIEEKILDVDNRLRIDIEAQLVKKLPKLRIVPVARIKETPFTQQVMQTIHLVQQYWRHAYPNLHYLERILSVPTVDDKDGTLIIDNSIYGFFNCKALQDTINTLGTNCTTLFLRFIGLHGNTSFPLSFDACKKLKHLDISGNYLTSMALAKLKASLPSVEVKNEVNYDHSSDKIEHPEIPEHRYALAFGNSQYTTGTQLPSSIASSTKMREILTQNHFTIFSSPAMSSSSEWQNAINWLDANVKPKSLIFLFFAGHGCRVDGKPAMQALNGEIICLGKLFDIVAQKDACLVALLDCCQTPYQPNAKIEGCSTNTPAKTIVLTSNVEGETSFGYSTEQVTKFVECMAKAIENASQQPLFASLLGALCTFNQRSIYGQLGKHERTDFPLNWRL